MPIYEYRCSLCGAEQEVLQKVSEPLLTQCPSCGKPGLQKVLTAAGFQLKGSGWYATDFKGGGSKKPEEKKTEKTETKTDTKTDTKPDSKTETKSAAPA
jgi:putative FmdB family regulatory protein